MKDSTKQINRLIKYKYMDDKTRLFYRVEACRRFWQQEHDTLVTNHCRIDSSDPLPRISDPLTDFDHSCLLSLFEK